MINNFKEAFSNKILRAQKVRSQKMFSFTESFHATIKIQII